MVYDSVCAMGYVTDSVYAMECVMAYATVYAMVYAMAYGSVCG